VSRQRGGGTKYDEFLKRTPHTFYGISAPVSGQIGDWEVVVLCLTNKSPQGHKSWGQKTSKKYKIVEKGGRKMKIGGKEVAKS